MYFPKMTAPARVLTYPFEQLRARLQPPGAGIPEANVDVLYDTQLYPLAGIARLNFFSATNADITMSNMEANGALAQGQYFDVMRIFVDVLREATATVAATAAGGLNDVERILKTARGVVTFNQRSRPLGPIPLTYFGQSGGASGFVAGNAGAADIVQFSNMPSNGGLPVNGGIKIGPLEKFGVTIDFAAPITSISADTLIRVGLFGVRYRQIG